MVRSDNENDNQPMKKIPATSSSGLGEILLLVDWRWHCQLGRNIICDDKNYTYSEY